MYSSDEKSAIKNTRNPLLSLMNRVFLMICLGLMGRLPKDNAVLASTMGKLVDVPTVLGWKDIVDCYVDAEVFKAWVTQELLPKISKISIIVMDNAAFPKRQDIQDSLISAGHTLEYWPLPISIPLRILGLNVNVFDGLYIVLSTLFLIAMNSSNSIMSLAIPFLVDRQTAYGWSSQENQKHGFSEMFPDK